MNRTEKETVVGQLREELGGVPGMVMADFTGLSVEATQALRVLCRGAGVRYQVLKNTLMKRAIAGTSLETLRDRLRGPSSFAWGQDPVAVARLLVDFAKKNANLKLKGGVLEGQVLDEVGVKRLADMPSRVELQSTVVGQALSPGRNLASQIKNVGGLIVGAIDALVERLEDAA